MIAVGEHPSCPFADTVHRAREPRTDRYHAAAERVTILRLHDEMRVIPLQRVVHVNASATGAR